MAAETYQGSPCRKAGHTERYSRGGGCAECVKLATQARTARKGEEIRARRRQRYRDDPNRERTENARRALMRKYGLTPSQRDNLFHSQGERCAICLTGEPTGSWNVDHCHDTGRVRGILCTKCNLGIGALGDSLNGLIRAAAYVAGSKEALARAVGEYPASQDDY